MKKIYLNKNIGLHFWDGVASKFRKIQIVNNFWKKIRQNAQISVFVWIALSIRLHVDTKRHVKSPSKMADQRGILPVEILQKIFHFLDGKTLLLLRSISSVWKDAIDEYLQKFSMKQWQWMCMETIPINSLIQFLKSELPLSSQ